MSDGGGGQQTATKEPWAEAAPWLKQNIAQGQNLQAHYQQNPFNQLQQTGYQNLFSDLDSFRNQMAPGLMQFANQAMNGGYQRPQYSRPGVAGYGGGAPQAVTPQAAAPQTATPQTVEDLYRTYLGREPEAAGREYWQGKFGDTLDAAEMNEFRKAAQPELMLRGPAGPFNMAEPKQSQGGGLLGFGKTSPVSQSYGLLDFNALNPYNGALKPAEITQPTQQTVEEAVRAELERRQKEAANQYDRFA